MSALLRVINNQCEGVNIYDIKKSDEKKTPLKIVIQEIEKTYILILTPL